MTSYEKRYPTRSLSSSSDSRYLSRSDILEALDAGIVVSIGETTQERRSLLARVLRDFWRTHDEHLLHSYEQNGVLYLTPADYSFWAEARRNRADLAGSKEGH